MRAGQDQQATFGPCARQAAAGADWRTNSWCRSSGRDWTAGSARQVAAAVVLRDPDSDLGRTA